MIFDSARTSDFVKWNKKAIEKNILNLECVRLWEDEPLDCVLQIVSVKHVNCEARLVLDCTQDCGQHIFYEVGREEYLKMSAGIGDDMLEFTDSFTEVVNNYLSEEKKGYNFEEDFLETHKNIVLGILPVYRKRVV